MRLYKDFDAHVRAAGLSSIEWRVLATLHDSEPLTVSQLAHEVLSKQPTVTKLVQRMGEQGWVVAAGRRQRPAPHAGGGHAGRQAAGAAAGGEGAQHEAAMLQPSLASEKAALKKLLAKLARR